MWLFKNYIYICQSYGLKHTVTNKKLKQARIMNWRETPRIYSGFFIKF